MNQKGVITVDFLFALVLAMSLSAAVFAMTFSLVVIEMTQYIAYSTARAMSGSDVDLNSQRQSALAKFQSLVSDPVLSPLYSNGWFEIGQPDIRPGLGNNFANEYAAKQDSRRFFHQGVRVPLTINLLQLKLPFLGTAKEEGGNQTAVNSLLIRENSFQECQKVFNARVEALFETVEAGRFKAYKSNVTPPIEDNGC